MSEKCQLCGVVSALGAIFLLFRIDDIRDDAPRFEGYTPHNYVGGKVLWL